MRQFIDAAGEQRILVIGDIILDRYINGSVTRVSPEDPTCLVLKQIPPAVYSPGGAANVACNIAAMGVEVDLLGLGRDDKHRQQLENSLARGIADTSGQLTLHTVTNRPYTIKTRYCANGRQLLRVDTERVKPLNYEEHDMLAAAFLDLISDPAKPGYDMVVLSDYAKGIFDPNQDFIGWLEYRLTRYKLPYVVDPKHIEVAMYGEALAICPNKHEWDAILAARQVPLSEHVVVTCGADGCIVANYSRGKELPPQFAMEYPVKPVKFADPVGAGDTFIAALAVALARKLDIAEACKVANTAARLAVMKPGTAIVSLAELEKELAHE